MKRKKYYCYHIKLNKWGKKLRQRKKTKTNTLLLILIMVTIAIGPKIVKNKIYT